MGMILAASTFIWAKALSSTSTAQQGGEQGIYRRESIQGIERGLPMYLNAEENQSLLTPGEFVEWKLTLHTGQIVVADASSEAFDPALEIVDAAGTVMTKNDDRYPGDQRPLVFWRCGKDGIYSVRARCFHDKSGGQVLVRFNTYESIDVAPTGMVEGTFDAVKPFFVRVPMKAGQVKDMVAERRGEGNYLTFRFDLVVSPIGLPERSPTLSARIDPAIHALIAPVAGDYYLLANPYGYGGGAGRVRIGTRDFVAVKPTQQGNTYTAKMPTNTPALFELSVKKGDLLEASTPELNLTSAFRVAEAPDFSKFDVSKNETNPFFPILRNRPADAGPALDFLPARARDGRISVFRARRDAKLWIASDGASPNGKEFTLRVKPAATEFPANKPNPGKMKISNTDYWAFEAKAGDVMTFSSSFPAFSELMIVRDPDLAEIRHYEAPLDRTSDDWQMIFQKPGRYLVAVACLGNGGAGDYSLSRKVLPAKEFGMSSPAKSEISAGQIQIWKFTATPDKPLLVHWNSSNWSYGIAIYDDKGQPADFQRQEIDEHNRFGILKVSKPQSFVIVLTGGKDKANYSIELNPMPR